MPYVDFIEKFSTDRHIMQRRVELLQAISEATSSAQSRSRVVIAGGRLALRMESLNIGFYQALQTAIAAGEQNAGKHVYIVRTDGDENGKPPSSFLIRKEEDWHSAVEDLRYGMPPKHLQTLSDWVRRGPNASLIRDPLYIDRSTQPASGARGTKLALIDLIAEASNANTNVDVVLAGDRSFQYVNCSVNFYKTLLSDVQREAAAREDLKESERCVFLIRTEKTGRGFKMDSTRYIKMTKAEFWDAIADLTRKMWQTDTRTVQVQSFGDWQDGLHKARASILLGDDTHSLDLAMCKAGSAGEQRQMDESDDHSLV